MATIEKLTKVDGSPSYRVRYRLDGRQRKQHFARKRDAEAFANTMEADKVRGVALDPRRSKMPVTDVAAAWLAAGTTKKEASTARDEAIVRLHIIPAIGNRQIGAVTKADVQKLVDGWAATKAPSTVIRQYATVSAIFSYAMADDLIGRTPCRGIRLPKKQSVDRPILDADQLGSLADALGPDAAVFMWLGVEGLRWSEVAGLTTDRVDLVTGQLTVDRQMGRHGEFGTTKTEQKRTFTICQALVDDLAALMERHAITSDDPDRLLFTNANGGAVHYSNWRQRVWTAACWKAGLPGLRFHDLRSLAATTLVAAGVDVKTTQTRMGHADIRTTLALYARAHPDADRRAADATADAFRSRAEHHSPVADSVSRGWPDAESA